MVAHLLWEQGAAGSNPVSPIYFLDPLLLRNAFPFIHDKINIIVSHHRAVACPTCRWDCYHGSDDSIERVILFVVVVPCRAVAQLGSVHAWGA